MDRLGGRTPRPLRTITTILILAAVSLLVFFGLVRVWGEVGGLGAIAAIAVGVAVWELAWERPRAARLRRVALDSRQQAPGAQRLRSEAGPAHWSDRLPYPLATIVTGAPLTLVALAVVVGTLVAFGVLLGPEPGDGRLHVRLVVGSTGEVRPLPEAKERLKVTILSIAEGAEVEVVSRSPAPGMRFWAVEVEIENGGEGELHRPTWKLLDSQGREHHPTIYRRGATLFPLAPGHTTTRWIVFEFPDEAGPQHLRVAPWVPDETFYRPREISFDAE